MRDNSRHFSFPETSKSPSVDVSLETILHNHFRIVERARVACAKSQSTDPRDGRKKLTDLDLVLKIYWPEESRMLEGQIVEEAAKCGEHNDHVKGHLPDLVCSYDLDGYSTANIRQTLGVAVEGCRKLRVILFRRLYPITNLIGDRFWEVFWECFRCHHQEWSTMTSACGT